MFMARFLYRPIDKSDRQEFFADFLLADYEAAVGTIYTSVSKEAVEVMPQEFAKLTVPTLMVSGEKDIIIPAIMGKQAAALSNKIEYVELPKTAHFPMLEDPSAYLTTIKQFLQVGSVVA
jgi:pimeloyl-ACP methyl ester carboxylesterase